MEYESEREMAIAYRMHNKGYDIGYIAATLNESEQTIEQSITPPKSPTIGEACKEARNSVPC